MAFPRQELGSLDARRRQPVWKSKFYGAFVLNHRVVLHAIDAASARWRGDAGSSPLDRARSAASLPRNDLVKNCRVHPTHRLISTQPSTCRGQSKRAASRASRAGCRREDVRARPSRRAERPGPGVRRRAAGRELGARDREPGFIQVRSSWALGRHAARAAPGDGVFVSPGAAITAPYGTAA